MNELLAQTALKEAEKAFSEGEIPVGGVVFDTKTGELVCSAHNQVEKDKDPLAHCEMLLVKEACRLKKSKNLSGCSVYVTLEPCSMCAAALSLARVDRVYFGAYDPKSGGVEQGCRVFNQPTIHHKPEVYGGFKEKKATRLLKLFFEKLREKEE